MTIVRMIAQATMRAAALHQDNLRYGKLTDKQITDSIKKVLSEELPDFINTDLKEAHESSVGEAWIRKLLNIQCNAWAVKALNEAI